ncbi:glutathione S-transferase domain-containing protein [Pestalotiopsis sp. NC0098]|nr:glutathione S-transferase domain-containing protein [Pestalotiopsis sp. NC0098]
MTSESPKIKLYTNHGCPWAHRAHIALAELGVPYEEEIIDLSVPRTPEYLKVNPRGLVPSLAYGDEIITESAVVSNFLADAFPSHLVPAAAGDPQAALARARIAFFADTFISKFGGHYSKANYGKTDEERAAAFEGIVDAAAKELDPLLANAGPFFGGSDKLTLAEVLTASFVIRLYASSKHGILPESIRGDLAAKAPNFDKWAQAVIKHPSVLSIWDEEKIIEGTKVRIAKLRAQA